MKAATLLILLVFGAAAYAASLTDISPEDRIASPESYLSYLVSGSGNDLKIEVRNISAEDVVYTSDLPSHFHLLEEEYIDGKWSLVMTNRCGGVVNDWKLKPGEALSVTITVPQRTKPRKFYFLFAVAGSTKKGIIEIRIKED